MSWLKHALEQLCAEEYTGYSISLSYGSWFLPRSFWDYEFWPFMHRIVGSNTGQCFQGGIKVSGSMKIIDNDLPLQPHRVAVDADERLNCGDVNLWSWVCPSALSWSTSWRTFVPYRQHWWSHSRSERTSTFKAVQLKLDQVRIHLS